MLNENRCQHGVDVDEPCNRCDVLIEDYLESRVPNELTRQEEEEHRLAVAKHGAGKLQEPTEP